ncbi:MULTISPECIES: DCC1-like thiol-disulfide oxidoreductase family protein [unclassified Paenibacillus]|uniref:thiol-disulfide oxidoreductase DCC family protein n=1 Tax=unclassified Paenibacillus TaxID=185978 RepID=UPI000953FC87|nr:MULTISPECIES: DCC1-like thiol-disulfide oxidoreductase family protein [unclassified Paenibacillus]ASS65587.1 DUF393 domain-containing protein [Paenibacillus sp. RUD330]SIQ30768.1 Predicted thiol-disulfide oxidoreductase YuxK, DCC family [Paenibacillus sp. RU4X]SIQ52536.1 Predicted thiol-disulfide oxidoreductase YuxK, DCC family [Paenibacillus sp. RU4T]
MKRSIALVDGSCALCGALTRFAANRDPEDRLRFAALQSEAARVILERHGQPAAARNSFVLVTEERAYTKGTAAMLLLSMLRGGRVPAALLQALPSGIRDAGYDALAKLRHRLAPQGSCSLLDAERIRGKQVESAEEALRLLDEPEEAGK